MATRVPQRRCTAPGCPVLVPAGRCDTHKRYASQQRAGWAELYGRDWPLIRLDYLSRHPRCDLCARMATIADHYPTGIKRLRARGIQNPHADHRMRPLCASCHSKETGLREPGGWNRRD